MHYDGSLAPIAAKILVCRCSAYKITSSVRYRSGATENGTIIADKANSFASNNFSGSYELGGRDGNTDCPKMKK
ncbi:hypothetical protein [Flavobacterium sp. HJJ]|uniref:hypothetical protein n=1 Tax=Flavobacterium sp. HJJ TaxID=2783792 RepID=UPI00188AE8D2|nr:hypothetical protein [Flavobacterium sp. HJJ]MBF4470673.1 hypothetical protein [Flavobacterium sp. HJJ]